jgi:cell division protein FtsB
MNALMNQLQTKWAGLDPNHKKYVLCGLPVVALVFLLVMILAMFHQDAKLSKLIAQMDSKRTAVVTEQINGMRAQIDKLAASQQDTAQIKKLDNELGDIEREVTGVAKSTELQKIATNMEAHLDELEKTVATSGQAKQYLDAKALPFKIIAVDVISQQLFVSVDYEHHITPLGIGDSLAGWKIISADYENVAVELQNNQGQLIKISVPEQV